MLVFCSTFKPEGRLSLCLKVEKDAAIKNLLWKARHNIGRASITATQTKVLVTQVVIKPLLIQTLLYELSEVQEHLQVYEML